MRKKKFFGAIAGLIITVLIFAFLSIFIGTPKNQIIGATFSVHYAEELGLDWQEMYIASLEELELNHLRIPVYWNRIEFQPGDYLWEEIDFMMDEAAARNVDITLAIGQKVPRWPECFVPAWAEGYEEDDRQSALLSFIAATTDKYKDHPALDRWQIENEAQFPFGECDPLGPAFVNEEIKTVKDIDASTDIQVTASGEQALWLFRSLQGDIVGVSLYRTVKNELGTITFPHSPFFYRVQALISRPFSRVIISELQAEPWGIHSYSIPEDESASEAYESFTARDLTAHVEFARATKLDEVYLWGIEWWYLLHVNGDSRLWDHGKNLIRAWNSY